jgi:hypothetical protein
MEKSTSLSTESEMESILEIKTSKEDSMILALGLTAGNFAWQLLSAKPNFFVALERSYFQAMAIFFYFLTSKMWP